MDDREQSRRDSRPLRPEEEDRKYCPVKNWLCDLDECEWWQGTAEKGCCAVRNIPQWIEHLVALCKVAFKVKPAGQTGVSSEPPPESDVPGDQPTARIVEYRRGPRGQDH